MDDEMNHNRSPMLTTDPYSGSRIPVAILGGTGLSGRHVYSLLHTNPMFECVAIIGSPASAGKPYIQTWREKEAKLQKSHSALNYRPLQEVSVIDALRRYSGITHLTYSYLRLRFFFVSLSPATALSSASPSLCPAPLRTSSRPTSPRTQIHPVHPATA